MDTTAVRNYPVSGGKGLSINRRAHWTWIVAALCAFLGPHLQSPTVLFAQQPEPAPNRPQPAPDAEQMVKIDFTEDIELRALVDYVSSRLTINILYEQTLLNQKITIRAPQKIPLKSLLSLLQSALRLKGFMLADSDTPGWIRIVSIDKLSQVAPFGDQQQQEAGDPITQVFILENATPTAANKSIAPFFDDTWSQ